ncbi:hypothetical protein GCM10009630_50470 [Kribbella jejuensis]|uniref:Zn-dependent protease with chaperone function n=1 Tax=Kribbella jejuensis TaxID=236068 RepID=A0A542E7W2_9ACTN|nr:hypothetical protein [Kribbella jejuensis]TQJ11430.1 hypothetical protein FB475_4344 [Kribbella jejuensis]
MTIDSAVDCPQCSRPLPQDKRYAVWCRHCGWNLGPAPTPDEPAWQLERERKLADSLVERPASGPERSLGAFLLSLPVLLVPLPGLLGGIALLAFYRPIWFAAPFAAVLFVITAIFRPRITRLPDGAQYVTRAEAPQLYDVLDRLAAHTGTPKLGHVVVTTGTRIAVDRVGWRYRRTLRIGLAAWSVLGPQERYAALAHALYDDQRGLHDRVLGAAQHIIGELAAAVTPGALDSAGDGRIKHSEGVVVIVGQGSDDQILHAWLVKLGSAVLGPPIRGYRRLLHRLDLAGRQRREYRIDRRVAEQVGSEPAAASLERVLLAGIALRALERAVRFDRLTDPLDTLRRTAAEIPDHEFARLVRVDQASNGRSDVDHPPTWQRTRLLRAHPTPTTSVFAPVKDDELRAAARAAAAVLHE